MDGEYMKSLDDFELYCFFAIYKLCF